MRFIESLSCPIVPLNQSAFVVKTELQFGLNHFHSGLTKPPHWSILIFVSDWVTAILFDRYFHLVVFKLIDRKMILNLIFDKVQFGFISSIIQDRSGSYYRKERQLLLLPYVGLVPLVTM